MSSTIREPEDRVRILEHDGEMVLRAIRVVGERPKQKRTAGD
jgi:hypothetical protein